MAQIIGLIVNPPKVETPKSEDTSKKTESAKGQKKSKSKDDD